jgi:hypothetical protein
MISLIHAFSFSQTDREFCITSENFIKNIFKNPMGIIPKKVEYLTQNINNDGIREKLRENSRIRGVKMFSDVILFIRRKGFSGKVSGYILTFCEL